MVLHGLEGNAKTSGWELTSVPWGAGKLPTPENSLRIEILGRLRR